MTRAWELAFAWLVLQTLDVVTTAAALIHGAMEVNPAMAGDPWRMVWLKVGVGALVVLVAAVLPARHERAAKGGLAAGLFLAGAVVAWNVAILLVIGGAA